MTHFTCPLAAFLVYIWRKRHVLSNKKAVYHLDRAMWRALERWKPTPGKF